MSRKLISLTIAASLLAGTALADVPRVAADIAPVHSLVARVMDGLGAPDLIIDSGASPHEYALRPSQAAALQNADIVFWVSPDLTPWLDGAIAALAGDAQSVTFLDIPGTRVLPFREGALFEAHDHGNDANDDHADEDDHDDHADEADHDDHDHGAADPHAWLSPDNAAVWLNTIAASLSAADPDNAGAYFANAAAGRAELATLSAEVANILDPLQDRNFIVFHDAYQYFEQAFDFPATGAISMSDAREPSPARIAEIRGIIADRDVTCILSEPQFNPGRVALVLDGSGAQTAVLDPLGSDLEPGAGLYPRMIRNLATTLADCL
ncbi:zinc ABC transporter substrate-binding protein [Yoonia sp.]|uniref:zinc ABC transporter substrate-binding protein n=1 Tax=Yoonia sp. TaxID=2212373 RepID=UPI0019EC8B7B|nr:zinc ABC transporter substrate-binding protein [Yoonia sp.]MBE0412174.1 zinc ABC transporter substrate-binding protein [Yoonia sp.]